MYGTNNAGQAYGGGWAQQGGTPAPQQQATPQQPAQNISLDQIMSGGKPSAFSKNDPIGTSVTGDITDIHGEQQRDFDTGRPLFWNDGSPRTQIVITLQTDRNDPNIAYDDGQRRIYVKGYNLKELKTASLAAGVGNYPRVGDRLTATFDHTTPAKKRGFNDAKNYAYVVVPKRENDLDKAMRQPTAQATPAQAPAAVQAASAQQPAPAPQQPAAQGAWGQSGVQQPTDEQRYQVQQLKAQNLTPQQIAPQVGLTVEQVLAIAGHPAGQPAGGEPEF